MILFSESVLPILSFTRGSQKESIYPAHEVTINPLESREND